MIFGKYINRYYLRYALFLLLGIAALIAVDYFQLIIPELYGLVVNGLNDGVVIVDGQTVPFDAEVVWNNVCKPMFVVVAVLVVGRFTWRVCLFGSGYKVERDLRNKMFNHCANLSCEFYQKSKIGALMSMFTNDMETIQDCFGSGVMMTFDAVFLGCLSLYKMFVMDWKLTLLSLIPVSLMLAAGIVVGRYMERKWDARQEAFSDLCDFAQESFSGIAVVKAFVKEFKELSAFKRLNRKNEDANVAFVKASALLNTLVTLFVESVICIILGYGGYLVYSGVFNAGQLMEYTGYFSAIVWPVMAVTELIEMTSRGKASLKRVSDLLDAQSAVFDGPQAVDVESVKGDIEFRNLTFRHPDAANDALQNVSFKISAGEFVGIVGKTGSGKTTVADLILRTYNVADNSLFIDGQDVNGVTVKSLRRFCSYCPQDNFLFSDTIAANIAFSVGGDEQGVREAAVFAAVDDNVREFKAGYGTVLGERGVTVSGGQKQRLSIARALIKDASILILDDSVSAVDTDTERTVLQNLRASRKGKTTILAAHRVSTVQNLDKIIVLDEGRVLDVGTHGELVSRCPEYKTMVELQKLEGGE